MRSATTIVALLSLLIGAGCRSDKKPAPTASGEAPSTDEGQLQPKLVFTAPRPSEHVFHDVWFTPDGSRLLALNRQVQVFDFDAETGAATHSGWLGFAQDSTPPPKVPDDLDLLGPSGTAWQSRYNAYKERNQSVTDLAFLDGTRIVAGGDRGAVGLLVPNWGAEPAAKVSSQKTILAKTFQIAVDPAGTFVLALGEPPRRQDGHGGLEVRSELVHVAIEGQRLGKASHVLYGEYMETMALHPKAPVVAVFGAQQLFEVVRLTGGGAVAARRPVVTSGNVTRAAFSPDGRQLFTTGPDAAVRVWTVDTSTLETTLLRVHRHHRAQTRDVDLAPDGSWMAVSSPDRSVSLWPTAVDGRHQVNPVVLAGLPDYPYASAVHPSGGWLVTTDPGFQVWRVNGTKLAVGQTVRRTITPLGSPSRLESNVLAARFIDPQIAQLVTGSGALYQLDSRRPAVLKNLRPGKMDAYESGAPKASVSAAAFVGSRVALGHTDGQLSTFSVNDPSASSQIKAHPAGVHAIAVASTACVLSGGMAGEARAWSLAGEPTPLASPGLANDGIASMALSPDAKHLAWSEPEWSRVSTGTFDSKTCRVVGPARRTSYALGGTGSATLSTSATGDHPGSLAFSPDGKLLLAGSNSGATVNVYRVTADGLSHVVAAEAHRGSVDSVAFLPDGRLLSAREDDIRLGTLDGAALTWTERLPPLDGAGGWTQVMTSSADGSVLLVGGGRGDSGTAWLYDTSRQ